MKIFAFDVETKVLRSCEITLLNYKSKPCMTPQQEATLDKLTVLSSNLAQVDYEEIKQIILQSLQQVAIPTAILRKGTLIDRVRFNTDGELFNSEEQISYIKDQNVIDNYLTSYQRASKPHQSLFYGGVESTNIPQQRLTALWETSSLLKDRDAVNTEGELFTIGRWEVLEDIELAEVVFNEDAIQANPDIKAAFEYHLNQIQAHDLRELTLRQLQFFSAEFAKEVNNHLEYKISVAFTDIVLSHTELEGIAFPSVQTKYEGQNVVLPPSIVDSKLALNAVGTSIIHKNKELAFVNNHKYVTNFGQNNANFLWEDMAPEHIEPLENIKRELGIG